MKKIIILIDEYECDKVWEKAFHWIFQYYYSQRLFTDMSRIYYIISTRFEKSIYLSNSIDFKYSNYIRKNINNLIRKLGGDRFWWNKIEWYNIEFFHNINYKWRLEKWCQCDSILQ